MIKVSHLKSKLMITVAMLLYTVVLYFTPLSCPFLGVFGLPCPGCGLTRAFISVLKFDFIAAFNHHAMFWSIPLLYICFLLDGNLFKKRWLNMVFYSVIAVGFVVNWVVAIFVK